MPSRAARLASTVVRWRIANLELMDDTCTISRYTAASDGSDNYTEGWADIATAVPCRIRTRERNVDIGPRREDNSHSDSELSRFMLFIPYDQDIALRDRVTIDGGAEYFVSGSDLHQPTWSTEKRLEMERVLKSGDAI